MNVKGNHPLPPGTAAATTPGTAAATTAEMAAGATSQAMAATGKAADVTAGRNTVSSGANGAMISVRDLRKKIDREEILRGIELDVAVGETLVIIGRSGGGKSVLLKNLIGLMRPERGEIWIAGQNIIGMSERQLESVRQKVGILFQSGALFDSMTVEDNIAFPLIEAGMRSPNAIRARVNEVLEVVELEGENAKMPESLSGGMRKRVGLARAIIRRPSCVLYDEPTSGLDPVVSDNINRLIRRLQHRFGMTSIVVTHDMKSATHVGDHIAYLHEGRIYFYGTPDELRRCQDPIIQDFLQGRSESTDR
jgi:phospholipid/cholesterol/gamma-HCH transport system ATP-binding protein